jgi:hypothetical protein
MTSLNGIEQGGQGAFVRGVDVGTLLEHNLDESLITYFSACLQ